MRASLAGTLVVTATVGTSKASHSVWAAGSPRIVRTATATTATPLDQLTVTFEKKTIKNHLVLLVASLNADGSSGIATVTDDSGNTWLRIFATGRRSDNDAEMWEAPRVFPMRRVFVTTAGGPVPMAVRIFEIADVKRFHLTARSLNSGFGASGTSFTTNAVMPAIGDFALAVLTGHPLAEDISPTSSDFTSQPPLAGKSSPTGPFATLVTGFELATSADPLTYTGTVPTSEEWSGIIAVFKHS